MDRDARKTRQPIRPTERRVNAIGSVTLTLISANGEVLTDRETAAREIELLTLMGQTPRWRQAVTDWAAMVRQEENPLQWAILQGAIYTGFEA
jgi:hypothetical protein